MSHCAGVRGSTRAPHPRDVRWLVRVHRRKAPPAAVAEQSDPGHSPPPAADKADGGEQWAFTLVPTVSCHVYQLCTIDGAEECLAGGCSTGEHLAPRPLV